MARSQPSSRRELAEVEADWRSRQRRLIGFAMTLGRLAGADERDGGVYVLGRDPDGRLRSFLRFASYRDGLSLDLMRRAGDEPNGLTEALVVAAIERARELGLSAVSLNFAGFAHVMAADAALSRSQRLLRLPACALPRPVPARAPGPLQREVLPALAAALSGLRRADLPPPLGPPCAASGGLPAGSRRGTAAEALPRSSRLAPGGDRRRRDLRRAHRLDACWWAAAGRPRDPSASTPRCTTPTGPSSTAGR